MIFPCTSRGFLYSAKASAALLSGNLRKIIEGSKHPFIETTTMLLPDEEVEHIKNRLAASD